MIFLVLPGLLSWCSQQRSTHTEHVDVDVKNNQPSFAFCFLAALSAAIEQLITSQFCLASCFCCGIFVAFLVLSPAAWLATESAAASFAAAAVCVVVAVARTIR